MYWAWKQGKEGRTLYEERDKAAEAGTIAHALVEAHIKNAAVPSNVGIAEETVARAEAAFGAYLSWERNSRIEIVDQEMMLVSEEYKYGGTPDAIGRLDGELCLIDWKTSNSVYSDMLLQLAAYRHLWEENHPDQPLTGGFHLCRFAKEHGDFAHHFYPDLSDAWEMFKHLRGAYQYDAGLKKRAA